MKKTILTAAALIALSTTAQAETFKSYEECVMARGESWVQVRIEWGGCDIIAKAGTPLPKAEPKVEVAKVEVAKVQPKVYVPKVDNSFQTARTNAVESLMDAVDAIIDARDKGVPETLAYNVVTAQNMNAREKELFRAMVGAIYANAHMSNSKLKREMRSIIETTLPKS